MSAPAKPGVKTAFCIGLPFLDGGVVPEKARIGALATETLSLNSAHFASALLLNTLKFGGMKRLLLVFLLIFFSMQSVWLAAAPYCTHEEYALGSHFGHHSHKHFASGTGSVPSDGAGALDIDCPVHHLGGCKIVRIGFPVIQPEVGLQPVQRTLISYPSFIPDGPDRPNWRLFA